MAKFSRAEAIALIAKAEAAAEAAYEAARPTPMVVYTPANVLTGEGVNADEPVYHVAGGVCGFAWVNIRPATSSFARQAAAIGIGRKSYYGGLDIRPEVGRFDQSYERKTAACQAYAEILREAGVKAFADGRLD